MNPYDSVPLGEGPSTTIRLLQLDTDMALRSDELISCKLQTVDLRDAPSYRALSYVWGSDTETKTITLNGCPFGVRKNLWDFLYQWRRVPYPAEERRAVAQGYARRRPYTSFSRWLKALSFPSQKATETQEVDDGPIFTTKYLWIDALCIDQSDISERGHQVSIMTQIYSSAMSVIVWLGVGNEQIYDGMRILKTRRSDCHINYTFGKLGNQKNDTKTVVKICIYSSAVWPKISTSLEMDYWTRAWTLQEYTLAPKIEVWCGAEVLDETSMNYFAWGFHSCAHSSGSRNSLETNPAMSMCSYRWRYRQKLGLPLRANSMENIWKFAELPGNCRGCTDVRDRVYASLFLLNDDDRATMSITPDYDKPASQLFEDLVNLLEEDKYNSERTNTLWRLNRLRHGLGLDEIDPGVQRAILNFKIRHPEMFPNLAGYVAASYLGNDTYGDSIEHIPSWRV